MSYKNFIDDFKCESLLSLEFEDDDRIVFLFLGIFLFWMVDNNFEGGFLLVFSGLSMWEIVFNCGGNCF